MKITIFKNPEEYLTREYELINASIQELENALYQHCEIVTVNPLSAAVYLPKGTNRESDHIIKGTSTNMSMTEVAIEILKINKGKKI
jgi:hypothetical protein